MSQQIDKKLTKQVRIDIGYWELVKILSTKRRTTIKTLVEEALGEYFSLSDRGKL